MPETILVALGGNALAKAGQVGTIEEQSANLRETLIVIIELIRRRHRILITHGNGPQVGHILIRAEAARDEAYELPLDVCVAQSQGEIGYLILQNLQNLLQEGGLGHRPIAAVLSRTLVDPDDPRMSKPSKPIGPFYANEQASVLIKRGWHMIEDAHRGYRRVVPSPMPVRIVEAAVIRSLVDDGVIVIACGGGGVPVSLSGDGMMVGVEAVVDKDLASSLLAVAIGADTILDLTAVEQVKLNFGLPGEQNLDFLTAAEATTYLAEGHFAPGSMGPKIEAATQFLNRGGREVIITRPERAIEALDGHAGTRIHR